MNKKYISPMLQEVLDYIVQYKKENVPLSPSLSDISKHLGVSRQSASNYVNRLIETGHLIRDGERLIVPGERYTLVLP